VKALFPLAFQPVLQSTPIQLVIPSHFRALHLSGLCFGAHCWSQRCIACYSALSMSDVPYILMQESWVQQEVSTTHSRKMSLPFTVRLTIRGGVWEGQYCGHGIDKVAYRIIGWSHVLKLTKSVDQEPNVFQTLQEHRSTVFLTSGTLGTSTISQENPSPERSKKNFMVGLSSTPNR
jgi:hypothetical protein